MRRAFLAVHWKGRPSGLAILCQLLSAGTLVPEFDTDADYLEAELEHLGQGADHRPKDGQWKLAHGWTGGREHAAGGAGPNRAAGKSAAGGTVPVNTWRTSSRPRTGGKPAPLGALSG